MADESKVANTSVGAIEYTLSGDNGPVLLFVHGTPGGYDQGIEATEDYRVLTPSRPGYLRTPLTSGMTPADQAKAYVALLDSLKIESVVVMGASGGGPSSISFAANYPERTIAFIAIETVCQTMDLLKIPWVLKNDFFLWTMFTGVEKLFGPEFVVRKVIPNPANHERVLGNEEKMQLFRSMIWSMWPASYRKEGMDNDAIQFTDLSLPIDRIKAPTLIIHGTADNNVPFSHGERLAKTIPDAEFLVIEDGDHMMPVSHQEEVEEAIQQFVDRQIS